MTKETLEFKVEGELNVESGVRLRNDVQGILLEHAGTLKQDIGGVIINFDISSTNYSDAHNTLMYLKKFIWAMEQNKTEYRFVLSTTAKNYFEAAKRDVSLASYHLRSVAEKVLANSTIIYNPKEQAALDQNSEAQDASDYLRGEFERSGVKTLGVPPDEHTLLVKKIKKEIGVGSK